MDESPFLLTIDVEPDWGVSGDAAVRETLPRFVELLRKYGAGAPFSQDAGAPA